MSRFFDSHAWNTRNRDAAEAVLRAAGLDPLDRTPHARRYVSAEEADASVRAPTLGMVPHGAERPVHDAGWLVGGGRVATAYRCRL